MRILVGHASRHGSTVGIAERIAVELRAAGHEVDCRHVKEVRDVAGYDAFVIGAAAYMYHWMKDATRFVKRHRRTLENRPTWLFSSGPLGTDTVDEEGRDVLEVSRPKEFDDLEASISPIDTQIFFGAWDPQAQPVGAAERLVRLMPAARDAIPAGDFRDWTAIEAWAQEIASTLEHKGEQE